MTRIVYLKPVTKLNCITICIADWIPNTILEGFAALFSLFLASAFLLVVQFFIQFLMDIRTNATHRVISGIDFWMFHLNKISIKNGSNRMEYCIHCGLLHTVSAALRSFTEDFLDMLSYRFLDYFVACGFTIWNTIIPFSCAQFWNIYILDY